LTPICTKTFVGWGFAPDPTGWAYSAHPDPLAIFRGATSKGRKRERRREEGRGGEFVLCHRKKKEKSAPIRSPHASLKLVRVFEYLLHFNLRKICNRYNTTIASNWLTAGENAKGLIKSADSLRLTKKYDTCTALDH